MPTLRQYRERQAAGPGPYEARQTDRSALAQSMAADVDPLNAALDSYWQGLSGQGQGGGWFGMNTVPQELNRLGAIRRQSGGLSPEYVAAYFDSPLAPGFGVMATVDDVGKAAGNVVEGITAYHGSPHTFDRFDMSKIGTGEGAQAYGHGLYFAEAEDVARQYRADLSRDMRPSNITDAAHDVAQYYLREAGGDGERAAQALIAYAGETAETKPILDYLRNPPGSMYQVRINASPDDFLDWDKPLSEQPEAARAVLDYYTQEGWTRRELRQEIADMSNLSAGEWLRKYPGTSNAGFTRHMSEKGAPGIKYLDAGSRAAGDGSRNYVVFDDKLIEILRRYGLLPPLATGGAALLGGNEAEAGQ